MRTTSENCPRHPTMSVIIERRPNTAPKTSNDVQKLAQRRPTTSENAPKTSKASNDAPKMPKVTQRRPTTSKVTQRRPKVPQRLEKCRQGCRTVFVKRACAKVPPRLPDCFCQTRMCESAAKVARLFLSSAHAQKCRQGCQTVFVERTRARALPRLPDCFLKRARAKMALRLG